MMNPPGMSGGETAACAVAVALITCILLGIAANAFLRAENKKGPRS